MMRQRPEIIPMLQKSGKPTSNDSDKVAVTARRGQQLFPTGDIPPPPPRDDNTRKRFKGLSLFSFK
jgi:hypothetical protein